MQTRDRWLSLVPLLFLVLFSACGPCIPQEGTTPTPPSSCHDGARVLDRRTAETTTDAGAAAASARRSDMTHNDMTQNALDARALAASEDLLWALTEAPLRSETLQRIKDGGREDQIRSSRELLEFIVSCALDANARPVVDPTAPQGELVWKGELGFCGAGSPYGDWSAGPPSTQCLQVVSSCLLARTNRLGKRVVISVVGESPALFPPRDKPVPVETALRENHGAPISSFAECAPGATGGTRRDCGWAPLHVGRCQAGTEVTLSADPAAGGACTCPSAPSAPPAGNEVMLRVCKGLYGCDANSTSHVPYAGYLGAQCACDGRPTITFTCPRNGPLIDPRGTERYGYYSVMAATASGRMLRDAAAALPVRTIGAARGAPNRYPATEAEVFTYAEGAFYGYVFPLERGQLHQCSAQPKPGTMLTHDMYACYSEIWSDPMLVLSDRYCAQRTAGRWEPCFENDPKRCFASAGDRCRAEHAPNGGAYGDCAGVNAPMPPWHFPLTVYLNHPCDLTSDGNCALAGGQGKAPPQDDK
ncbi:putative lipoprotein [Minicystis rosea]|nr:putative lipoprotein [Minicystis rosea]